MESCCQCGREVAAKNRPVCRTCRESGRRSAMCAYGENGKACFNAHLPEYHPERNSFYLETENVSLPTPPGMVLG